MYQFDKVLMEKARKYFCKVFCDKETPEQYIGSLTETIGDRLRIYYTDWDYETEDIIRNNEELEKVINDFESEMIADFGLDMFQCMYS